jgi:hypothetical protein
MAITTLAQLQTAKQQAVTINKTGAFTGANGVILSSFDQLGEPSGSLAGSNTANGVVPTSSDVGYPYIKPFASGSQGCLKTVSAQLNSFGRVLLFDRLFLAGAYAFNASVTLTSQPSFASRVPNSDYSGLEIWVENVTALVGTPSCTIGYTNESGVNSRSTTLTLPGGIRRCQQMPLQTGDSGVQQINSVTLTGATGGSFNVMVLRRLHDFTFLETNGLDNATMFDGFVLEPIYATSALYILSLTTAAGSGLPRVKVQIAEG